MFAYHAPYIEWAIVHDQPDPHGYRNLFVSVRSYFDRALDLLGALGRLEVEPRDFVARVPRPPPAD